MRDILCFSLWGNKQCYLDGLLANIREAPRIYPGFEVVPIVHIDTYNSLDAQTRRALGSDTLIVSLPGDWTGMFWRMIPILWTQSRYVLVRDADSLITHREKLAVDEWIESRLPFHIMRDHPDHTRPIMGGMFGADARAARIKSAFREVKHILYNHTLDHSSGADYYQTDQDFLAEIVFPQVRNTAFTHDSFYHGHRFPVECKDGIYVGKRVFT